jgi:protein-disulfide isomerase
LYIKHVKPFLVAGFLIFSSLFFSFPLDANAAAKTDSYAEEQILQTIRKHPEIIMEAAQLYQQQQEKRQGQLLQEFSQQIKLNPDSMLAESPTTGATKSKVILVEFSDFQCPYCSGAYKTLKEFLAGHNKEVTLVYKHLPLENIHSEALPAAKAAWAAGKQGRFWEYHDSLFEKQKSLSENLYLKIARSLKLDINKFDNDRTSKEASSAIQKDIELAKKLEISGTPFFIMDTEYFSGAIPLSDFEGVLNRVSSNAIVGGSVPDKSLK